MKLKALIKENVFRNFTRVYPADFKKFAIQYKKIDNNNVVKSEKDYDEYKIYYGFKKGQRQAEWKYIEDEMKLYSDMSDSDVWRIKNGRI
jgi:hypothetical protein